MMTQNEDGTPHMTYYDYRRQASFVWDGKSNEIEVSLGGYAEPVDHTLRVVDAEFVAFADAILLRFETTCKLHLLSCERCQSVYDEKPYRQAHYAKFVDQLVNEGPAIGDTRL
jgi:hypothetical protein